MLNERPQETIRAYRLRFYPTLTQGRQLAGEFGNSRWVWNFALGAKSDAWRERNERLSLVEVSRWLTEIKRDWLPWLRDTASTTATQALRDLDTAFRAFFEKRARYPRFKRRRTEQAVRYQVDPRLKNNFVPGVRLGLPLLGPLKVVWSQVPKNRPKMVTVKRDAAGRYWVCFSVEEKVASLPHPRRASAGVDMGLNYSIALSDGTTIEAPRHQERDQRLLAHRQRTVSRRRKGSERRKDAVHRVARVHQRIRDRRQGFLHDQPRSREPSDRG